jgi:hypothetical protein
LGLLFLLNRLNPDLEPPVLAYRDAAQGLMPEADKEIADTPSCDFRWI